MSSVVPVIVFAHGAAALEEPEVPALGEMQHPRRGRRNAGSGSFDDDDTDNKYMWVKWKPPHDS